MNTKPEKRNSAITDYDMNYGQTVRTESNKMENDARRSVLLVLDEIDFRP